MLRIPIKANPKHGDVYVAVVGNSGRCVTLAVDVALDDEVPMEEIALKRQPKAVVRLMMEKTAARRSMLGRQVVNPTNHSEGRREANEST